MGKGGIAIAAALIVGLAIVATRSPSSAEQEQRLESLLFGDVDCRKGTVEQRLDCLTAEIVRIKRLMEGREGRVMPLRQ
jgi:hypothetical protein